MPVSNSNSGQVHLAGSSERSSCLDEFLWTGVESHVSELNQDDGFGRKVTRSAEVGSGD